METKIVTSSGMARTHSSQYATLCAALALFLISLATPSFASSYSDIDSESIYQSKDERYGHLEYVGFYASAMQHWNYTDALAPYTNLTWLAVYDADTIVERIRQAEAAGVKVVLKVLQQLPDVADNIGAFDRFLQEYELIAEIDHPNIVSIYDLGVSDEHAHIAMEYVDAGDLRRRISAGPIHGEWYVEEMPLAASARGLK